VRSWSLRSRLLALVLVALLPAFVLLGWNAYQSRTEQVAHARNHVGDLARLAAFARGRLVESAHLILIGVARSPIVREKRFGECAAHFAEVRASLPHVANLGFADPSGRLRCSAVPAAPGISVADREYFREALARNDFTVGHYQVGRATDAATINFGLPVSEGTQLVGVAFVAFDLSAFDALPQAAGIPADAVVVTADRAGVVLHGMPPGERSTDPGIDRMLRDGAAGTAEMNNADGEPHYYSWAPVMLNGERVLSVAIGIPKEGIVGPIDRGLIAELAVLLAVLFAALTTTWFGYERSIVRPVQGFLHTVRRIAQGELSARAGPPGTVREFNQIQAAFNEMALALEQRVGALQRAEIALRAGEERYRALFELSPDAVFVHAAGRIRLINGAGATMYGAASPRDLEGIPILDLVDPAYRDRVAQRLAQLEHGSGPLPITEIPQRRLDGGTFVGQVYTTPYPAEGPGNFVTEVRDVTARHEMELALRESEAQYRTLFEKSPIPMWVYAVKDLRFLAVNEAAVTQYGYSREAFMQMTAADIRPPEEIDKLMASIQQTPEVYGDAGIWRHRRKDGTLIDVHVDTFGVAFRGERARLVLATDVTERLKYEARIEYLATHDGLTGLPNRTLFADRLAQAVTQARRDERGVAVLMFDVDNFKIVNDSFGHPGGDEVLKGLAARFSALLREGDTVARLGGDEFVILLGGIRRSEDVGVVIRKMRESLAHPFEVEGTEVFVTGSIGVSTFPADGDDLATLLRNADVAMYKVKEGGRNNSQYFTAELGMRTTARVELEAGLRRALEREEFEIHFQPQVDLYTRRIVSAEGLIRWRAPQRGLVPPGEFIRCAEETGLIVPMGTWMLRAACRQLRAWREAGLSKVRISINVSARQFREGTLLDNVREALAESKVEPGELELELTEGLAMGNVEGLLATLAGLKSLGVSIAIDDFGTGYSSLSYLKRFPIDRLKIDQSFVRNLPGSEDDAAIARTIIALGRSLGLHVIAEGVETYEQLEFLRLQGCDEAQGYYFGRPMPAAEFEPLLDAGVDPALWRPAR
jgi:diguanylate cyclase (GGDEF)-like protein/PAS domain S-box-containing protein